MKLPSPAPILSLSRIAGWLSRAVPRPSRGLLLGAAVLALVRLPALPATPLPSYVSDPAISGTVRIWGNPGQGEVVRNWQTDFANLHPSIKVAFTPRATSTAIASLYVNDAADLALMGREIWHIETQAFVRTFKYIPSAVKITSGSFDNRGDTEALGFFVQKDNPISRLNYRQIDAIFGAEHLRGPRNFRKWGDLGLTGKWADQPIHLYGYWLDGGEAEFVRQIILKNSYLWNSDYRQFWNTDETPEGVRIENAGQHWTTDQVIDGKILVETGRKISLALARDPYGIALNAVAYTSAETKAIAVADGGEYVSPTREHVADRTYPLTRSTYFYYNRPPGQPINPAVKEFLRYVLSREGQAAVAREGKALPLTGAVVSDELRKLE